MDIRKELLNYQNERRNNILKGFASEVIPNDIIKGGEGSKGGNVIGHTKSGKPIYATQNAKHEKTYTSKDHLDAAYAHLDEQVKHDKESANHSKTAKMSNEKLGGKYNEKAVAHERKAEFHSNKAEHHSSEYDRHMVTHKHKAANEELDKK